tara:strand:+ start:807 stop:1088 length:282 start_codon:yes stop_codon:yes gene_type:complete
MSDEFEYIYKMAWYKTRTHIIPTCVLLFQVEEDTRWGWNYRFPQTTECRIYVVRVLKNSSEYDDAVVNSENKEGVQKQLTPEITIEDGSLSFN